MTRWPWHRKPPNPDDLREEFPYMRGLAPVQVRISGAADDVRRLTEFLAAIPGISASPAG